MEYAPSPKTALELSIAARARMDAMAAALPMSMWLPTKTVDGLDFSYDQTGKQALDVAEYRNYDSEAPYGRDAGSTRATGTLPPISRKRRIGEWQRLQLSGVSSDALGNTEVEYTEGLADSIALRFEYAKAQSMVTGTVTIVENNVSATYDFGRDASLSPAPLVAAKKWDVATSTPIDDVQRWRKLPALLAQPTAALMTSDVMEALTKNPDIIKFSTQRTADLPSRISIEAVKSVFGSFGVYNVTVVEDAYSQFQLPVPMFPAGTFMLLPSPAMGPLSSSSLGELQIGIPAEALNTKYGIPVSRRAGAFSMAYANSDPEGMHVLVSAIGLPVMNRANATFATKVL